MMRLYPFGALLAVASFTAVLTACDSSEDPDTTEGTEVGTEVIDSTEAAAFETGIDIFGIAGEANVTFNGDAATVYSGTTQIFDRAAIDGPLGTAGDILCQYVYPATGTPFELTQEGVDSDNNPSVVTCEGCDFAFELTHDAPTIAGEGPYCEYWYADTDWGNAFPVLDYIVAYHPAYDMPDTEETESDSAILQFYDGSGDTTQYDDDGNEIEIEAQWFASGAAILDDDTLSWTNIISYYQVFEIGYYE
ncbi:MAG: hypothetical protein ACJAZO_001372 [Myxococcota bacterium]|jgi:hypothetical protein